MTGTVLGLLGLTILVAWVSRDLPNPDKLTDRQVAQSTKIYDRTGTHLLYEIFANEKRTLVDLNDIPKNLVNGVIATEDTTFFQHKGVRPLSILRSIVYGLIGKGTIGGGASTLTQQLVKNAILTNEKTLTRKLKEIILSIQLEQKYTKDQILKIYFNEIPYGSTNYGVEAASESYFGKQVKDLDLQESATLAGLPQAPSYYLANLTALKNRRDFVLQRMFEEHYITQDEEKTAQALPLTLSQHFGDIHAPHFSLYVKDLLTQQFGEQMVDTGGLKVITTLDWDKQQIAEKVIKDVGDKVLKDAGANNAALVAIDPKTGQILAMVGSRNFFDDTIDGQFNVVTQGKRQPGSSFKPIIYAAAFEKGYTPDTMLFDVSTNFSTTDKEYRPVNYTGKEYGPVTMRTALQGSLNIPSVETMYLVGPEAGKTFAARMGYTTLGDGDFGLTLVLGGGEVKLLEHTNAYAVFAANGIHHDTTSILHVEDPNGNVLFDAKPDAGEKVLDPGITATISNVLSDDAARAFIFGAGGTLTLPDRPVAAKTGTTNKYVDAWTVGYTPSLVAGVWAGNTNNTPMKNGFGGSMVAAKLWNAFMREAVKGMPVEQFPDAPPNDALKPILRGSAGGSVTLPIDRITGKIATSSTPPDVVDYKTFTPAHSILQYVNKDDPRGPVPDHPENDSQYTVWEQAIADWTTKQKLINPNWGVSYSEPPTEYDTPDSLALIPTVQVMSPAPSSTISTRDLTITIQANAPRGVTKVSYAIDGNSIGENQNPPFNLNYFASGLANGPHILTVTAEDDQANRRIVSVPFVLLAP